MVGAGAHGRACVRRESGGGEVLSAAGERRERRGARAEGRGWLGGVLAKAGALAAARVVDAAHSHDVGAAAAAAAAAVAAAADPVQKT